MPPRRRPTLSFLRWLIASSALLVGVLGAGALPSVTASSAADEAAAAEFAAFEAAFDPEADRMGSTIRKNEPTEAGSGVGARTAPDVSASAAGQPYGMDVSGHQGNVDWPTAYRNGARFAYVKATESTSYRNPYFGQQYNGSAGVGMKRGAYHFALPNRSSGAAQANFFVDNGGGWTADGRTLPPMLDIEYNPYGPTCYSMSPSAMSAWIGDFSRTIRARTGRYPTIYSTRNWWDTCTGSNASFGANHPLFIARYASTPGAMPAGWGFQTMWQYNDRGIFPGDQDVFNGSEAQLAAFARGSSAPAAVASPIGARYAALGGSSSVLGAPVGGEYAVPGGTAQNYRFGRIYHSAATGAREVHGAILDRYLALGGPGGLLGLPTTDETTTPDGVGGYNHFSGSGGSIYWTPATGAHEVHGAIRAKWAARGWERGSLGYPTTDETRTSNGTGRYNNFSGVGGSIYWSPPTGAYEIEGLIRSKWMALGGSAGLLGYPVTDETGTADGGGRYNDFSARSGSIYWSPATGAREVEGAIRARWLSMGGVTSELGYPVSDEYAVPGGRRSDFAKGSVFWEALTGLTVVTAVPDPTVTPTPSATPSVTPSVTPSDEPSDDPSEPPPADPEPTPSRGVDDEVTASTIVEESARPSPTASPAPRG